MSPFSQFGLEEGTRFKFRKDAAMTFTSPQRRSLESSRETSRKSQVRITVKKVVMHKAALRCALVSGEDLLLDPRHIDTFFSGNCAEPTDERV